jgi:hypothetical protein
MDQRASIEMPSTNHSLIVGVQSILYTPDPDVDTNNYALTKGDGFYAFIDSTFPYLWLPPSILDAFAEKFQLQYDEENALYTVNESAHNYNLRQNAKVVFTVGHSSGSTDGSTSISLPYAAFDLEARFPLISSTSDPVRYFPIKKSPKSLYVLGRAFLQEAYLTVDYDRRNFSIAQAKYANPMPPSVLVPILHPTQTSPPNTKSGDSGLAPGAIAGIAVGVVIGFLLLLFGGFLLWKKKRRPHEVITVPKPTEYETPYGVQEVKPHYPPYPTPPELESNAPTSPQMSLNGWYGDQDRKITGINEMESPQEIAELESPPIDNGQFHSSTTPRTAHGEVAGYFDDRLKRRGATRESSGQTTSGIRVGSQEIAKEESPLQRSESVQKVSQSRGHSRAPSEVTAVTTTIDAVVADSTYRPSAPASETSDPSPEGTEAGTETLDIVPEGYERVTETSDSGTVSPQSPTETRTPTSPAHARGPSDATVESAVSGPTPEELAAWEKDEGPMRPLSE